MNPSNLNLRLRPRTVLETCDLSIAFVRAHAGAYARLGSLWLGAPAIALWAVSRLIGAPPVVNWLALLTWCSLVQGLFTALGARLLFNVADSERAALDSMRQSLGRYLPGLLISRASKALQLASVLLAFRALSSEALTSEVLVLEGLSGRAARQRVDRLGRRQSGRLSSLSLAGYAAFLGSVALGDTLGQTLIVSLFQLPNPFGSLWEDGGSLFSALGYCVAYPFWVTSRLLTYIGGRSEDDGWDIQIQFMAIDSNASGAR